MQIRTRDDYKRQLKLQLANIEGQLARPLEDLQDAWEGCQRRDLAAMARGLHIALVLLRAWEEGEGRPAQVG